MVSRHFVWNYPERIRKNMAQALEYPFKLPDCARQSVPPGRAIRTGFSGKYDFVIFSF